MYYNELFGVMKLRCPNCNHTKLFYTGRHPEYFCKHFSEEERTCEHCKSHVWNSHLYRVTTDQWTTEEIVEAISAELENQNKYTQTEYPSRLARILAAEGVPKYMIQNILIRFFKETLQ